MTMFDYAAAQQRATGEPARGPLADARDTNLPSLMSRMQHRSATPYPDSHNGWSTKEGPLRYTAACPGCGADAEWCARQLSNGVFKRNTYTITCPTEGCTDSLIVERPAA